MFSFEYSSKTYRLFSAMLILLALATGAYGARSGGAGFYIGFEGPYATPEAACQAYDTILQSTYVGVETFPDLDGSWDGLTYNCLRNVWNIAIYRYPVYFDCPPDLSRRAPGVCLPYASLPTPPVQPTCNPAKEGLTVGNPVVVAAGTKYEKDTDLIWGRSQLHSIYRTYLSYRPRFWNPAVGYMWTVGFEQVFQAMNSTSAGLPTRVDITNGNGSVDRFDQSSGVLISATGGKLSPLNQSFTEWAHRTPAGEMKHYKKSGSAYRIESVHTKEGLGLFFKYAPNQKVSSISDSFGRTIDINWSALGLVESIRTAGSSVSYTYDHGLSASHRRLKTATIRSENGQILKSTKYHYVDDGGWQSQFLLAGIEHQEGVQFSTYTYDDNGRVSISEHAGGANRYVFSYEEAATRTITDPKGTPRRFSISRINGQDRVTAISQPGGSGCAPAANRFTYNASGLLTSQLNFNQKKSCFNYDSSRRLQTSRFEGLGANDTCPAPDAKAGTGQRKISTAWHPNWDVEVRIAEPLRRTDIIYNGQPDVDGKIVECANNGKLPDGSPIAVICKKIIQATNDPNGSLAFSATPLGNPQIYTYSYTEYGQILSSTEPSNLALPAHTTRHEYYSDTSATHTKGDLWKTVGPTGHTVEYLEYNPAGFATLIRDPRGQLTELSYDGLQRLTKRITSARTSTEEITTLYYNDVGLLTRVDMPDSTYLEYTYDQAERLTDIRDKSGNTIHYTLDGMGNRIREEISDQTGKLTREVVRVYDALNRLQNTSEATK